MMIVLGVKFGRGSEVENVKQGWGILNKFKNSKKSINSVGKNKFIIKVKMGKEKYWEDYINNHGSLIKWEDYPKLPYPNRMSRQNIWKALEQNGRIDRQAGYTCGLNALNMANKMLGYTRQWDLSTYPYTYIYNPLLFMPVVNFFVEKPKLKWGLHSGEFGRKLIDPYYKSYSWKVGDNMPWDIIDGTDFTKEVVIVLVQFSGNKMHYILLIGANEQKTRYITTDQSEKFHWISQSQLRKAMEIIGIPNVAKYCAYRVG